jgi:hypothetical protein
MARKDRTTGTSGKPNDDTKKNEGQDARQQAEKEQAQQKAEAEQKAKAEKRQQQNDEGKGAPAHQPTETDRPIEQKEGEDPQNQDPKAQPMPTPRGARQPDETDPNADPANPDQQTPRTAQTFAQADHPDQGPLRLDASGRPNPELQQEGKYDPRALTGEESKGTEIAGEPLSRPSGQAAQPLDEVTSGEQSRNEQDEQKRRRGEETEDKKGDNDDPYEGSRKFKP